MSIAYRFSILRYRHDPVTQEFVNVGVALHAPSPGFLAARCLHSYSRISAFFGHVGGRQYRRLIRYIEDQINREGSSLPQRLDFGQPLEAYLARILPPDDSALQFSPAGAGVGDDPAAALEELYRRHVCAYAAEAGTAGRTSETVWRTVYKRPLERRNVLARLEPKLISSPNYEREFAHAWKNQIWHVCEPVSFDLQDAATIADKANRWLGRAINLAESPEPFRLHLLLGRPLNPTLRGAMIKAENILNKMPLQKELVREEEAEAFAQEIEAELH